MQGCCVGVEQILPTGWCDTRNILLIAKQLPVRQGNSRQVAQVRPVDVRKFKIPRGFITEDGDGGRFTDGKTGELVSQFCR
ncbi:hypothetical protein D3C76_1429360 [compost metagenome]